MLYVCLPTYNEAVTVGVLLWRLRTMLREQADGRDYEIVVYDDASADATPEVLAPYARVLPLTLLRGATHLGQAAAVDALVRHVVARSRAPESDALVLLQADYTDAPDVIPAVLAPFDAGADAVLTRRAASPDDAPGERRLRRAAALLLPPLLRATVRDTAFRDSGAILNLLRLFRVSVLRDALRAEGGGPLVATPGRAGTAELALRTAPFAHRVVCIEVPAHPGVRTRASRLDWTREMRATVALLWRQRRRARRGAQPPVDASGAPVAQVSAPVAAIFDAPTDVQPIAAEHHEPRAASRPRSADRPRRPRDRSRATTDASPNRGDSVPAAGAPGAGAPAAGPPVVDPTPLPTTPLPTTPLPATARPEPTGQAITPPHDAAGVDGPSLPKPARRRRRGRRGRSQEGELSADAAGEVIERATDDPLGGATDDAANDGPAPAIGAAVGAAPADTPMGDPVSDPRSDVGGESAGVPAGGRPAKRRRRRGGTRRRGQSPGDESGVPPDDTDADSATWHGAPSDQPSS